jgi:hypothetical protein
MFHLAAGQLVEAPSNPDLQPDLYLCALCCLLHCCVLCVVMLQMGSGFSRLLSAADDLVLDIPDAVHLLSLFLGR